MRDPPDRHECNFEYNLSAALPALKARGDQQGLVTAIERALWVASAHQDLSDADVALALLHSLSRDARHPSLAPSDVVTIAGSLFSQAIILYARATETTPIDRERWFGREKLKGEDRSLHIEVMDLRDHALAHFGKAETLADGPLVREALVLRRLAEGAGIVFYSNRAQNRAAFARHLHALVERVKVMAFTATQARYADLGRALSAASQRDPELPKLMRDYPFAPADVFEIPEWRDAFDGKPETGAFTSHGAIERPD